MQAIVLLALVSVAVAIFIASGRKTVPFDCLEKEVFETEYGVTGMVKERKAQYNDTYTKGNIAATSLCILSILPLLGGIIINKSNLFMIVMLSLTLTLAGIGAASFIRVGIIWASYEKLLQEGDYAVQKKKRQSLRTAIGVIYWSIALTVYLAYSLATNNWGYSWIVWPVAGVLYPAVTAIIDLIQ